MTRRSQPRSRRTDRRRAICGLLGLLLAIGCAESGSSPAAVDGRMDLTHWDFSAGRDVALLGTWEICWGQLLEPHRACPSSWRPVPVPALWSEEAAGSPFGGRGVATYRLRIALAPGDGSLSLLAGAPFTAYRLFIDGIGRGGVGVVGPSAGDTRMGVRNRVYDLPAGTGEVQLLVQVANFEFRGGGLRRLWYIGRHDSIERRIGRAVLREGMVFSVGVVVGLAYLLLFALGPAERARGYFGLASLVLGLRAVPASTSGLSELMVPWAGFGLLTRCEYLGTAIALFAGAGYARTKVAGVVPPRTTKGIQLAALALGAIVAFAPFPLALATLPLQYALPLLLMGLLVVGYGGAWARGVPGVRVTAAASGIYSVVVVHDIARTLQAHIVAPLELYPYAMVLWILAEGSELMQRFYRTFARVASLSEELSDANFELQETESAIVRFVPFDFLRMLGKRSIRDVQAGDRVRSRIGVLHCGLHRSAVDADARTAESDFDTVRDLVARVEPLVHRRGGFVNEFGGDGFQAFFPGGASAAVAAGVEIVEAARRREAELASRGRPHVEVGIGIDTGPVLLGTIGSREQVLRGVVGEAVDTARRIEALATRSDASVLVSAATRDELGEAHELEIRALEGARVETASGSIGVYEVRAARAPEEP